MSCIGHAELRSDDALIEINHFGNIHNSMRVNYLSSHCFTHRISHKIFEFLPSPKMKFASSTFALIFPFAVCVSSICVKMPALSYGIEVCFLLYIFKPNAVLPGVRRRDP